MVISSVLQIGIPEIIPDIVGIAATVVLLLIVVALGGVAYKSFTGDIEWPEAREEDEDTLQQGGQDDEWDYY